MTSLTFFISLMFQLTTSTAHCFVRTKHKPFVIFLLKFFLSSPFLLLVYHRLSLVGSEMCTRSPSELTLLVYKAIGLIERYSKSDSIRP